MQKTSRKICIHCKTSFSVGKIDYFLCPECRKGYFPKTTYAMKTLGKRFDGKLYTKPVKTCSVCGKEFIGKFSRKCIDCR